jgi:hypothetical protein
MVLARFWRRDAPILETIDVSASGQVVNLPYRVMR